MPCGRTEWGALEGHSVNQSPCQVLPPHEQRPCVSAVRTAGVGGGSRGSLFQRYNGLLRHRLVDNLASNRSLRKAVVEGGETLPRGRRQLLPICSGRSGVLAWDTEGRAQHLAPGGAACISSPGFPGIFASFGMGRGRGGSPQGSSAKEGVSASQSLPPSRRLEETCKGGGRGRGQQARSKSPRELGVLFLAGG